MDVTGEGDVEGREPQGAPEGAPEGAEPAAEGAGTDAGAPDDAGAEADWVARLEAKDAEIEELRARVAEAVLLESDPSLGAAVDPSSPWQLSVLTELGGAATVASARDGWHPDAEDALVRSLAAEIAAADAERASLERDIAGRLAGDETHGCPPAVPGVGPKTATALAALVDVSLFDGDDRLASYCGLAPADSRSGTPVDSSHSSRAGDKTLKNLLISGCNSLVGTKNRFGRYYDECASRGMRHNRALKAVARKRLGVIYAVMRDRVPYEERPSGADVEKPPATA